MSFAYNFFVGTVQTLGASDVFSSMTKREEVADLVMAMYSLQSARSGLDERMMYHPREILGLLHFQAASFLFEKAEELEKLKKIKKKFPDKYKQGIDDLAMTAYVEARNRGRDLNASGSTVRKFLSQFPA